jgi:MFS family permease
MNGPALTSQAAWWRQLDSHQWFVFLIASSAWFFDCLDQRIFSLARNPALAALLPADTPAGVVQATGKDVTAVFLLGWGLGGLVFGALGDRHGRAKMLKITVLIYSVCTGLTYFSRSYVDFAVFRFLTGVGVGGVFGLAVALVAETVPEGARAGALAMLQILSALGNISAALLNSLFAHWQRTQVIGEGWRWLFLVGAVPAAMVLLTGNRLREPVRWLQLKSVGGLPTGPILAPYVRLLREQRWRKNLAIGAILASTGVIGLWAIGKYRLTSNIRIQLHLRARRRNVRSRLAHRQRHH